MKAKALFLFAVFALAAAGTTMAAETNTKLPAGLELLRRTERAFAKATSEIGIRNGFMMFFAPDAISPPDTGSARTRLAARPAPVEPRPTDLAWEPLFGDIAKSTDLGYLTGPSSFSEPNGTRHDGVYFSVWRRSAEGLWLVVFDAGVDMPSAAPEFADGVFHAAPASAAPAQEGTAALAELQQTERDFLAAMRADAKKAYEKYLDPSARMHREGLHPILGRDAILARVAEVANAASAQIVKVDVSAAGDLGWTFDAVTTNKSGKMVPGGSARVWRRDDQGRWRIVVDILNPERG